MTDEALELLRDLVRQDTTSGDNAAQASAQELAVSYATAAAGVRVLQRSATGRPWVLLGTGSGSGALFVCHIDTVPVGSPDLWERAPFSADTDEECLHGRGSVDMKGGLVAALAALRNAAEAGTDAQVLITSDEEIGCRGAAEAAGSLELTPRIVVVPEATQNRVSLGHRGATWLRLAATGKAAHGSTPHLGRNAIQLLAERALGLLGSFPLSTEDYLGEETVNVGTFEGGTATNIVPASAVLTLDVRTVDGGAPAIAWASSLDPAISAEVDLDLPAVRTPGLPDALAGHATAPAATYFTDASALAGSVSGAPIVIWGPGDPREMHAADEKLELESWRAALRNYRELVLSAAR
ncbi:M20 family metallopeptidase [Amycolatopsis dendrobii]|uniref:M20/M25/M40 family metallo-hydrolase n=1 Tax=Amycolatopsis dendrobii TaxID=2760662 RepID=A0A7W3W6Q3_9PSEU|nr:M20/M25/M40 family metallo-hydrolase [Amycolatopsis dendrobii]MBB1159878.1 M20/M25/M40 family metallo-hydrolase [Amycolatopsis dendrobii]